MVVGWAIALLATQAADGRAQLVTGALVEDGTLRPVAGAAVYLVDASDTPVAVVLSDGRGAFRVPAPAGGAFRLQVERIGFEPERSEPFDVAPEGVSEVSLSLRVRPIELDPLDVETGRVCRVDRERGRVLARVWSEARKALTATVLSADRQGFAYVVEVAERELDRDLGVRREDADTTLATGQHAFGFVPVEELSASGWGSLQEGEILRYYAPSPEVLLSSWFGATHCFDLADRDDPGGRLGLAFESIADSLAVGMEGVFWIDPSSWRLQEIEFRYRGFPDVERARHQGGRIGLAVDGDGGWYVSEWTLRRPILARGRFTTSTRDAWTRTVTRRMELRGYAERAGRVLAVERPGGR